MKLSKSMARSHMRYYTWARGRQKKTWITNMSKNLADPKVPLKFKLYQVRRWPRKILLCE